MDKEFGYEDDSKKKFQINRLLKKLKNNSKMNHILLS